MCVTGVLVGRARNRAAKVSTTIKYVCTQVRRDMVVTAIQQEVLDLIRQAVVPSASSQCSRRLVPSRLAPRFAPSPWLGLGGRLGGFPGRLSQFTAHHRRRDPRPFWCSSCRTVLSRPRGRDACSWATSHRMSWVRGHTRLLPSRKLSGPWPTETQYLQVEDGVPVSRSSSVELKYSRSPMTARTAFSSSGVPHLGDRLGDGGGQSCGHGVLSPVCCGVGQHRVDQHPAAVNPIGVILLRWEDAS